MAEHTILISLFSNIWSIFLVILFFGGSIFVHELGHFLAARRRGLIVERFSIGFGPKIIHWKRNGVEYCISLLPLGGYVALPQLADMQAIEGESKAKTNELPPISFTDKLVVSSMGVIFNLIFAFILACIVWAVGLPSSEDEQTTVIGYIQPTLSLDPTNNIPLSSPALIAGLKAGDKILKIDNQSVSSFSELKKLIIMGTHRDQAGDPLAVFTVQRGNEVLTIPVKPTLIKSNPHTNDEFRFVGISPYHKITLREAPTPSSPASKAGLIMGDTILAMNGEKLYSSARLVEELQILKNTPIDLSIQRKGEILNVTLTPALLDISKPICLLANTDIQSLSDLPKKPQAAAVAFLPTGSLTNLTSANALKAFSQFYVLETYPVSNPYIRDIKPEDHLVAINNLEITSFESFLKAFNDPARNTHTISLERQNRRFNLNIPIAFKPSILPPEQRAMIGIETHLSRELVTIHPTPWSQFQENITMTLQILKSLFSPGSDIKIEHLMGPPGIARAFHAFSSQDFRLVLWFTIILNINLAILNILPIPVLDGGHIVFAIIAKLRNKPLPFKFIAGAQSIFMLMLFSLMIYVSFNDVRRWLGDNTLEAEQANLQSYYISPTFKKS